MARRYKPGDVKWIAYPDGVARVEIEERGSRGFTFRDGKKPDNPYVVNDGDDRYVVGEAELHDNPVDASKDVAKMRSKLGLAELGDDEDDEDDEELEENELDDEDDEEFEDEDDEELDDELEED